MIVVDTNVLAYALIDGDRTALALQVGQRDPQWVVPLLWRYEFLNVMNAHSLNRPLSPGGSGSHSYSARTAADRR